MGGIAPYKDLKFSRCFACGADAIWFEKKLLSPRESPAPQHHPKLPEALQADYEEAREIVASSPRGAAALLRLVVQKLCAHLSVPGRDLNAQIGQLVARGLPIQIQQALDAIRVIGNNAIHPLEMDIRDDLSTALTLFELLNLIVDYTLAKPEQIAELYKKLPAGAVAAIEKRDANNGNAPAAATHLQILERSDAASDQRSQDRLKAAQGDNAAQARLKAEQECLLGPDPEEPKE